MTQVCVMLLKLKGAYMLKLKKYFNLLIVLLNLNIFCVSDYSDSQAESCMEELDIRQTKSEDFEDNSMPDFFDQNFNSSKNNQNHSDHKKDQELKRLSSELIIVSEQVKELRKRLDSQDGDLTQSNLITAKIRAQQIIEAIDNKWEKEEEKKWIKNIMPQLTQYINNQAKDGETPLNRAISACNYNFFSLLIIYKANPDVANSSGKTAHDYIQFLKNRLEKNNNATEDEKKIIKLWDSKYKKLSNNSKFNKLRDKFNKHFKKFKNKVSSSYEQ